MTLRPLRRALDDSRLPTRTRDSGVGSGGPRMDGPPPTRPTGPPARRA